MILAFLIFLVALGILLAEGCMLAMLILGAGTSRWVRCPFALPLATLSNVILVYLFTALGIPLDVLPLFLGHLSIICIAGFFVWKYRRHSAVTNIHGGTERKNLSLRIICGALLSITFLYSFSHAVIIPSFQVDSFANWTMRAKVSFIDQEMAFDRTEARGIAKPQYPFLVHALQITANQGQRQWSDRIANTITFLLSLTSLFAAFTILRRLKGTDLALLGITLITGIPLLTLHLAQGYGDIHLITYILLSLITLFAFQATQERPWLLLSGLFAAASVWTKSEGLIVGLLPWILLLVMLYIGGDKAQKKSCLWTLLLALFSALPFPLFIALSGFGLTPHSSDFTLGWHGKSAALIFPAFFKGGSLGITWFLLPVAVLILLRLVQKNDPRVDCRMALGFVWGIIALLEVLATYTLTPNAQFLVNGESFYRQMLIPTVILIVTCVAVFRCAIRRSQ